MCGALRLEQKKQGHSLFEKACPQRFHNFMGIHEKWVMLATAKSS